MTEAEKQAREAKVSVGTLETEKEELEMKIKEMEEEKKDLEKEKSDLEAEKQVYTIIHECIVIVQTIFLMRRSTSVTFIFPNIVLWPEPQKMCL